LSILLYCVAARSPRQEWKQAGVAGTPVSVLERAGLVAFLSTSADSAVWLRAPVRTSAVEFHRVCMEVFRSEAIIPYRFPTIFQPDFALSGHLDERADDYHAVLQRIAGAVQMEVRVTWRPKLSLSQSGAEYLRERQERLLEIEAFAMQVERTVQLPGGEWRRRMTRDGFRGFGLLERGQIDEFKERTGNLSVPATFNVRVSGPWPVTEFLDLKGLADYSSAR
jgi:hypothetical protein